MNKLAHGGGAIIAGIMRRACPGRDREVRDDRTGNRSHCRDTADLKGNDPLKVSDVPLRKMSEN